MCTTLLVIAGIETGVRPRSPTAVPVVSTTISRNRCPKKVEHIYTVLPLNGESANPELDLLTFVENSRAQAKILVSKTRSSTFVFLYICVPATSTSGKDSQTQRRHTVIFYFRKVRLHVIRLQPTIPPLPGSVGLDATSPILRQPHFFYWL